MNTKSTSLRIMMLVILFFGLLMLNSYSAVLVSRLAVDKADIPFKNLDSIAERPGYVLCVRENSYAYRNFKVCATISFQCFGICVRKNPLAIILEKRI